MGTDFVTFSRVRIKRLPYVDGRDYHYDVAAVALRHIRREVKLQ
jgi:hypothetical protein